MLLEILKGARNIEEEKVREAFDVSNQERLT
jgi:hypothetical protein